MKKKLIVVLLLITGFAGALFAGKSDCIDLLNRIAALLESKGFTVNYNESKYGFLSQGESFVIKTTCYNSSAYAIVAAGGNSANDVDIAIYDENGNLVDEDSTNERYALGQFAPRWTGTFFFKVTLHSGDDFVGYVRGFFYR